MRLHQVKDLVGSVGLPTHDEYFEKSSIDGYAFLALGRLLAGLDIGNCLEEMQKRVCGLNAPHRIRGTEVPPDAVYVYSTYPCVCLHTALGNRARVEELVEDLDRIGRYENGMMRYCSVETHYVVPNVTALAAEMYCHDGRFELARELLGVLATRQRNGSWQYEDERSGEELQYEDSFHLAMMIHSFREAARLGGGDTSAMVTKAVKVLKRLNRLRAKDRVGWNWPYVAVAARGFERSLATRALWMTRVFSLRNRNFRVRAIAAWALARLGFGGSEGAPRETGEEEKEDASQRIHEDIGGLRRLWKR